MTSNAISLAIGNLHCQGNCVGCHSPFLRTDIGVELTAEQVSEIIEDNYGVNCFLFLGEGNDRLALEKIASYIKEHYSLKLALYSGRNHVEDELYDLFDYVKVGPYIAEYGPLNYETTNQHLYRVMHDADGNRQLEDITYRFWKKK